MEFKTKVLWPSACIRLAMTLALAIPTNVAAEALAISGTERAQKPSAVLSAAEAEQLRARADSSDRDKVIAEAKSEVIAAGTSRLEVWIGLYGVLIGVMLAAFGIFTYRRVAFEANRAAKEEFQSVKQEIEILLDSAKTRTGEIANEHAKVLQLSAAVQARVDEFPSSASVSPLLDEQKAELEEAAEVAIKTPLGDRTAQEFRLLMFRASQEENWQEYVDLAEGMSYLHRNDPNELAYALFGKAYGQWKLGNHKLSSNCWEHYFKCCPNDNDSDRASAYSNWGNAITSQAKLAFGKEADALFKLAAEKYDLALEIDPTMHDAHYNGGVALSIQALSKKGRQKISIIQKASEKYRLTTELKPDHPDALNNWGNGFLVQYTLTSDQNRAVFLDEAEAKCSRAESLKNGAGAYNLACINSLRGHANEAAKWLRIAKQHDTYCPDCSHILADSDFENIRDTPEFRAALADIGCGPSEAVQA